MRTDQVRRVTAHYSTLYVALRPVSFVLAPTFLGGIINIQTLTTPTPHQQGIAWHTPQTFIALQHLSTAQHTAQHTAAAGCAAKSAAIDEAYPVHTAPLLLENPHMQLACSPAFLPACLRMRLYTLPPLPHTLIHAVRQLDLRSPRSGTQLLQLSRNGVRLEINSISAPRWAAAAAPRADRGPCVSIQGVCEQECVSTCWSQYSVCA